jgi:hypothetical protein
MVVLADAVNTAIIGKGLMIGLGFNGKKLDMGLLAGMLLQEV